MCTEPLSLSMGCLEDSCINGEFLSPYRFSTSTTNSLNRRKIKPKSGLCRNSWGPSEKDVGKQEFWASIQEPYDFIMRTHLMPESCEIDRIKEHISSNSVELELSWDPSDVSPSYEWSYSEFLAQYNELYEWLIQVQLKLYSHSNPPDKASRMVQHEELHRRTYRRKIFVEQGSKVAQRNPSSAEEISWRVNYLNNKWEQLLTTLTPLRGQTHIEVDLDLAHEEEILCGWLSTMESQIQPLTCRLPRGLTVETLQERYKGNQILLKDIEAHGPILKSVLRQYERLANSDANLNCKSANAKNIDSSPLSDETLSSTTTNPTHPQFTAIDPAPEKEGAPTYSFSTPKTSTRIKVPRRARSLEKRWHQVYLRSLEWHYYLEGAIANFKNLLESGSSESDDEPVTKCRRLSYSSSSSTTSFSSSSRRRRRSESWSLNDLTPSENGSYIEDDYVSVNGVLPETDQRKRIRRKQNDVEDVVVLNLNPDSTSTDAPNQLEDLQPLKIKKTVANMNCEPTTEGLKEKSSILTEVDRPSINFGVFECKHQDTDSEDQYSGVEVASVDQDRIIGGRKVIVQSHYIRSRLYSMNDDEEMDQEADLQNIIDSAIPDPNWLDSNLTSDSESIDSVPIIDLSENVIEDINGNSKIEVTENSQGSLVPLIVKEPLHHSCSTESIAKLINDVEHLVSKEDLVVSPRQFLKPLSFGSTAANKQHRLNQWLSSQSDNASMQDSCDASGELTTGDSDSECGSSNRYPIICRSSADIPGSSENTPTAESLSFSNFCGDSVAKVVRRGKKRTQNDQRPWSISEIHQLSLFNNSKGSVRSPLQEALQARNSLSSSETALNHFSSSSFDAATTTTTLASCESYSLRASTLENEGLRTPTSSLSTLSPSKNGSNSESPQTIVPRSSTIQSSTDSLKKRRSKFRRRSLNYLGRRADSGSDERHKETQTSDAKSILYSPYQMSLTKSISSDSDSVSLCPRLSKSFPIGQGVGLSCGGGVTSSTEQYLSDSSLVSGVPKTSFNGFENTLKRTNSKLSAPLLLPQTPRNITSDNDASNTQEDVSSLSEQAWDPYQEYKYLSEPYSEDVDQDAVRRLLDFGDDYSKYIDSECSSLRFPRRRRSPHHKKIRTFKSRPSADSDSDIDDLHHVIQESKSQLDAMESVLEKHSPEATLCLDFGELLTTIKTNLKCLHEILKHLEMDAPDLQTELSDVKGIIHRWTVLESKAMDRQRQSSQLRQLQRQMKNLRLGLESISDRCSTLAHPHSMALPSQLKQKVEEAKNLLEETEKLKSDMSSLNVVIHRFVVDVGPSVASLKDDVAELYRIFDDTQRRVNAEISRLESAEATWRLWEEQKQQLMDALKQDKETLKILDTAIDTGRVSDSITASVEDVAKLLNQKRGTLDDRGGDFESSILSNIQISITDVLDVNKKCPQTVPGGSIEEIREDHLSDSGTSGYESCSSDDLSERERRLAYLRRLARDLEANLAPGSKAWSEICQTLSQAEKELRGLQSHCQNLILKTAENLEKGSLKPPGFAQTSNNKRRNWPRENKRVMRPDKKRSGRNNRGWVGRVARAALPFQVALLLLFCVACLLEPNCCDSVNTLNLSFSPQLRYVHGAPPT